MYMYIYTLLNKICGLFLKGINVNNPHLSNWQNKNKKISGQTITLSLWILIFNPFASGIKKVFLYPITGLFSVKIRKQILAIKNLSVNDMMSGQPNKHIIHWHFEN